MVRLDGVGDRLVLAVLAQQLGADDGVAALDLVGERLADVVQERAALDQRRLDAELGGHHPGDVGGLDQVAEHVLAVAGAVLQPAEGGQQPLVEIGDADIGERVAGRAQAQLVDLELALLVGLLDAVRVDAAVEHELVPGSAGRPRAAPGRSRTAAPLRGCRR